MKNIFPLDTPLGYEENEANWIGFHWEGGVPCECGADSNGFNA
jgi:hypothetical protein